MITRITGERVFEALFIVGLGVVWEFDMWWPGILIAFGASYGIALLLRERYWQAGAYMVLFSIVPVLYIFLPLFRGSIPFVIVGLGAAGLLRALRSEPR